MTFYGGAYILMDSEVGHNFDDLTDINTSQSFAYHQVAPNQFYAPDSFITERKVKFWNVEAQAQRSWYLHGCLIAPPAFVSLSFCWWSDAVYIWQEFTRDSWSSLRSWWSLARSALGIAHLTSFPIVWCSQSTIGRHLFTSLGDGFKSGWNVCHISLKIKSGNVKVTNKEMTLGFCVGYSDCSLRLCDNGVGSQLQNH